MKKKENQGSERKETNTNGEQQEQGKDECVKGPSWSQAVCSRTWNPAVT